MSERLWRHEGRGTRPVGQRMRHVRIRERFAQVSRHVVVEAVVVAEVTVDVVVVVVHTVRVVHEAEISYVFLG